MLLSRCQREKARTTDAVLALAARCEFDGGGRTSTARGHAQRCGRRCAWLVAICCCTCRWAASSSGRRNVEGRDGADGGAGSAGVRVCRAPSVVVREESYAACGQDRPEAARAVHSIGGRPTSQALFVQPADRTATEVAGWWDRDVGILAPALVAPSSKDTLRTGRRVWAAACASKPGCAVKLDVWIWTVEPEPPNRL